MQVQEKLVRRRVVHKSQTGKKRTLLLQSLFCTDRFLRRVWRALPESSLEQQWLQVYRPALHQQLTKQMLELPTEDEE